MKAFGVDHRVLRYARHGRVIINRSGNQAASPGFEPSISDTSHNEPAGLDSSMRMTCAIKLMRHFPFSLEFTEILKFSM